MTVGTCGRSFLSSHVRVLEHERDALARADAHAEHAVARFALAQLGGERQDVAGAGRAERVADRDRAAVGVELLVGNLEAVELVGSSRSTPSACAANASWTSQTSICSGASPARLSAFGIANAGAIPMILRVERVDRRGDDARQRLDAELVGRSPMASTTALAPSFSGEELPAVIWVVFGCGGSAASLSAVVSSRMLSSCSNVRAGVFLVAADLTGWISFASRPSPRAAAACCWERSANASISSRVS